jgi:FSR family fosmidomycin resistance protein-like MFS transporter
LAIHFGAAFYVTLPYANLFWTGVSDYRCRYCFFSAILVFAGINAGKVNFWIVFGFAFGMGGLGSALLGYLADQTSIEYVYKISSYLPLIGIFTYFYQIQKSCFHLNLVLFMSIRVIS